MSKNNHDTWISTYCSMRWDASFDLFQTIPHARKKDSAFWEHWKRERGKRFHMYKAWGKTRCAFNNAWFGAITDQWYRLLHHGMSSYCVSWLVSLELRDQEKVLNTLWQANFIGESPTWGSCPSLLCFSKSKPPEITRKFLKKGGAKHYKNSPLGFLFWMWDQCLIYKVL